MCCNYYIMHHSSALLRVGYWLIVIYQIWLELCHLLNIISYGFWHVARSKNTCEQTSHRSTHGWECRGRNGRDVPSDLPHFSEKMPQQHTPRTQKFDYCHQVKEKQKKKNGVHHAHRAMKLVLAEKSRKIFCEPETSATANTKEDFLNLFTQ